MIPSNASFRIENPIATDESIDLEPTFAGLKLPPSQSAVKAFVNSKLGSVGFQEITFGGEKIEELVSLESDPIFNLNVEAESVIDSDVLTNYSIWSDISGTYKNKGALPFTQGEASGELYAVRVNFQDRQLLLRRLTDSSRTFKRQLNTLPATNFNQTTPQTVPFDFTSVLSNYFLATTNQTVTSLVECVVKIEAVVGYEIAPTGSPANRVSIDTVINVNSQTTRSSQPDTIYIRGASGANSALSRSTFVTRLDPGDTISVSARRLPSATATRATLLKGVPELTIQILEF